MVIVTNSQDLESIIEKAGAKLIVMDFHAKWCGPCKQISPLVDRLATKYASGAVVLKVDVDKCDDIASKYKISSIPTFLFMKRNKMVGQFSGADSENLKNYFAKYST